MILLVLGQFPLGAVAAVDDAEEISFNTRFTGLNGGGLDLARFARANRVLPGEYRVDLFVNGELVSREDVEFRDVPGAGTSVPCFNTALLEVMQVDFDRLDPAALAEPSACLGLAATVAGAEAQFAPDSLHLNVSIPQISLVRHARGYVRPELWDRGINAATLGYNVNAYQSERATGGNSSGAYLGLDAGLNLEGWRIRSRGSVSWSEEGGSRWESVGAYAQHDLLSLRSQLTAGDSFTTGDLFPSTGFRGLNIASDDRMLPDSMVGFAPVVRGTAETRARVEIRQNDFLVYETTVAPGAFEISDLYATAHAGDLEVRVIEADGRVRSFTVPYASVSHLMRPGHSRYSFTLGETRMALAGGDNPLFAEGTYQRGLNNWLTGYGGIQATNGDLYRSVLLGGALNTPVGAVSVDVTGSRAVLPGQDDAWSGYSVRAAYNKSIPTTGTNFALAAYRYSSAEYLSLTDAVALNTPYVSDRPYARNQPRDRFQLNLSQKLGARGGSLYAAGTYQRYRDTGGADTTFNMGYNNNIGRLRYGLNASRSDTGQGRKDTQYQLTVSMPLDVFRNARSTTFTASAAGGGAMGNAFRAGLSGVGGEAGQYSYAVNAANSRDGEANFDASASWQAPYATLGGAYSWAETSRQASVSASGGIVAHSGGFTLAQRLGDTIGIVEAKGARGARLANGSQGKVDARGYAVVSNLMPYRMNNVEIDPNGMSMDVELESSRLRVAPRAGAVVPLHFDTTQGRAALIEAKRSNGQPLAFGARVMDLAGNEVGLVGQGGRVFARYGESGGKLVVQWGEQNDESCLLTYRLPERDNNADTTGFTTVSATCD